LCLYAPLARQISAPSAAGSDFAFAFLALLILYADLARTATALCAQFCFVFPMQPFSVFYMDCPTSGNRPIAVAGIALARLSVRAAGDMRAVFDGLAMATGAYRVQDYRNSRGFLP